jgi:D-alanyl-D-alanine carboxypeptidase
LGVFVLACGEQREPGDEGGTSSGDAQTSTPGTAAEGQSEGETTSGSEGEAEEEGSSGGEPDDPGDPWDPVPPFEPMPDDAVAELRAAIDGVLDDSPVASATQGVLVVDLETDQVLYERNADMVLVPASNTKMFTTAASIDILGEDHRMVTEVVADVEPDDAGVVAGDLHLLGDHDFTWSTYFYASARFPLDRLAADLYTAGVRQVTGAAIAHGEFCWEGDSLGTFDVVSHRNAVASQFLAALQAAGIAVNGGSSTSADLVVPDDAVVLAEWASVPVSHASVHVNGPSHNEFADIMLRHLGWETAGESTYEAGGLEMVDWMPSLPTSVRGVAWNDGSGLSHGNRVSARNLVDLVRFAGTVPQGEGWLRGLAISGVRGTIGSRMTGPDTWGRVYGKTGTLGSIGVVSLSGVLYHLHDRRRYAFSILFNGAYDVDGARGVADRVVEAFAIDRRGVSPGPAAPTLRRVVNEDGAPVLRVAWTEVPDVDGYAVWLSPDGKAFDIDDARYVQGTEFRLGDLPWDTTYVRVTAVHEVPGGPVHSFASDVYGARSVVAAPPVLVVDGNDRWAAEPVLENPRGIGHDFAVAHGQAIAELGFDAVANEAIVDGDVALADYEVVLWALGEESDVDSTFDPDEQQRVTAYLQGGGALLVSGAELGYDLVEIGSADDVAFMLDVLRAGYEGDDAATTLVGAGAGPFADVVPLQFTTLADQEIAYPDVLTASEGSTIVLQYLGGAGSGAGVAFDGDGRTIVLGFPFESIDTADGRALVMERSLAFLRGG